MSCRYSYDIVCTCSVWYSRLSLRTTSISAFIAVILHVLSYCNVLIPNFLWQWKNKYAFYSLKEWVFFIPYNSVRSSACIKVVAEQQMLRGSILTSLWSHPYSPWALWISLLKVFLIHLGNNWDQLEVASSGANLQLKIPEMQHAHQFI